MTDITIIIQATITLMAAVVTIVIIPLIRTKTTATQQQQIQAIITTAVFAAEQLFQAGGAGAEKKSFVLNYLAKMNVTYDPIAIDAMIEAAVKNLNIVQK